MQTKFQDPMYFTLYTLTASKLNSTLLPKVNIIFYKIFSAIGDLHKNKCCTISLTILMSSISDDD